MTVLRMTLLLLVLAGGSAARADVLALCYHDIHETQAAALHDPYGVSVDELVKQFNWLKGNGFTPITLGAYQAATSASELPPKPVILTFDDGYASFYEHAFPL